MARAGEGKASTAPATVFALIRTRRRQELQDLLTLLRDGPDAELALTDPALFRTLREAGTKAFVSGVCSLRVPAET